LRPPPRFHRLGRTRNEPPGLGGPGWQRLTTGADRIMLRARSRDELDDRLRWQRCATPLVWTRLRRDHPDVDGGAARGARGWGDGGRAGACDCTAEPAPHGAARGAGAAGAHDAPGIAVGRPTTAHEPRVVAALTAAGAAAESWRPTALRTPWPRSAPTPAEAERRHRLPLPALRHADAPTASLPQHPRDALVRVVLALGGQTARPLAETPIQSTAPILRFSWRPTIGTQWSGSRAATGRSSLR
jgi:hypothetical protein